MLRFQYSYQVVTTFSNEIRAHALKLRCQPAENAMQRVEEENLVLSPYLHVNYGIDAFGNRIVYGGTDMPHSTLEYSSTGIVAQREYCIPDPEPAPFYRMPSRLTLPSADIAMMRIDGVEDLTLSPYDRALLVGRAVNRALEYSPNSTTLQTTAAEALAIGKGVCQDFAHLMITLCRLHGIPARYANGFIIGVGVTHAWVEVYDGRAWRGIDPTHDTFICSGYIKLAHGRDALDCTVDRGTFTGLAEQRTEIKVTVKQI